MPNTPFPITGILYDVDGSTALASVKVKAFNATSQEQLPFASWSTTDASGYFSLDLANLTTQWAVNDYIFVIAFVEGKQAIVRAKITTGDVSLETNLYMKSLGYYEGDGSIVFVNITGSAAKSVHFIERRTNRNIITINIAANGTATAYCPLGLQFDDGIFIVPSAQGTTPMSQGAGVTNAIGDTSSNAAIAYTVKYG